MKKMKDDRGFFEMNTTEFSYHPSELAVPHYILGTFGKAEMEEAAAWLAIACQEAGSWCGVSIFELIKIIRIAKEKHTENSAKIDIAEEHNKHEWNRYYKDVALWIIFCVISFGAYYFFKRPAKPTLVDVPKSSGSMSLAIPFGPAPIINAYAMLEERGYVVIQGSEDEVIGDVVFPTVKFADSVASYCRS